jgi:hypothetical protein
MSAKSIFFFITTLFVGLVLLNVIEYSVWSQVSYIHECLSDPGLEISDHRHIPRYLLVLPAYAVNYLLGLNIDTSFGLLVSALLVLISINLGKTVSAGGGNTWKLRIAFFIYIASFSLFMNGRMLFSLLGMSMFLSQYCRPQESRPPSREFVNVVLALWLASVSSGAFATLYSLFVIQLLQPFNRMPWKLTPAAWIRDINKPIAYALLAFFPLLLSLAFHSISYFPSITAMLNHGHAGFIGSNIYLVVALVGLAAVGFFYYSRSSLKYSQIYGAVLVPVIMSAVGWATLAMALPPIFVIIQSNINKR